MAVENFAIRLLGPLEVERDGGTVAIPTGRQRTLLSLLAVRAGRAVPTEVIAEHLWGEEPPPSARATLRGYVLRLRRALTPRGSARTGAVIGSGRNSYWLETTPQTVDTYRFKDLTAQAAGAAATGDPGREADLLRRALSLWRGSALSDVTGDALHREVVPPLEEERLQALQRTAELRMAKGEHAQAAAELRGLVAEYPLRDGLWGQLMLALYGAGHQSEALLQYERCRETLAEALGVDPDPQVRELHRQILTDDPALRAGRPAVRAGRPAVRPEREKAVALPPLGTPDPLDGALRAGRVPFVGRENELATLSELAVDGPDPARLVVMDGAAGVGKSALALHWARQVAARFPDGCAHVDLRGFGPTAPLDVAEALETLLTGLGVPAAHVPAGVPARQALLRTRVGGGRTLLVLDNAADADQVRPLLTSGATVLVTSRDQLRGLVVADGARRLTLDRFPADTARDLLTTLIGPETCAREPRALDELAALCGHSALTLCTIAESATRRRVVSLERLAADIRADPCWAAAFGTGDGSTDLVSVLRWSYDALAPGPAGLYRALGLLGIRHVTPESAARLQNVSVRTAAERLDALARLHLVEEQVTGRMEMDELSIAFALHLCRTEHGSRRQGEVACAP